MDAPELFYNRELSWLDFNQRVLREAQDKRTPLLERLKFISIVGSNLDEFFMKRIGGLKQQVSAGVTKRKLDGFTPEEELKAIRPRIVQMVQDQRACLMNEVLPALRKEGVYLLDYEELTPEQVEFVTEYYKKSLFPILIPLGVGPGQPFPFISNLSLSVAVRLRNPSNSEENYARVKVPQNRPRWLETGVANQFVPIEQVIAANLETLFMGMQIIESCFFRVTRSIELSRNEDEAEDLLELIEEELRSRQFAPIVRLEMDRTSSPLLQRWLKDELHIGEEDLYVVNGPISLRDMMELSKVDHPQLKDSPWKPVSHRVFWANDSLEEPEPVFSLIQRSDILVHHPYESFGTSVERFLREAVRDPQVLAIKQTLYRTAEHSPIIDALIQAAANGKQVAVLVEIKARLDEEKNIQWVRMLEKAGIHVTYGFPGIKTHSKTLLVVREEPDGIRRYYHIGTGNYHPGTANLYTDLSLLSCRDDIGEDIADLFNALTGHSNQREYKKLLIAPVNMRKRYTEMIQREIEHAKAGRKARIFAKMNQLEDREIIELLYKASKAGVQIDLIIRGICCLRPGLPEISENIRVMSIIGRFLEHTRIFYFHNDGEDEYYFGSADWMRRNLDFRVEAAVPVESPELKHELKEIIDIMLNDNRFAWDLLPDGTYKQRRPRSKSRTRSAHNILMERAMKHLPK